VNTRLWTQPLSDQVAACDADTATIETLVRQTRDQIDQNESRLHAWVELASDIEAQARAVRTADRTLPLRGISVGVKDLIDVAELPTRAGSTVTASEPVAADAPVVARLRALGAVVQGKTVTTEYGYFAPGPTRNPHSVDHTPGGSSSGSAAAVAAGTIPLALGTQTAGSLTRPASYCGATGMVLAHGTTDMSGITGLSESLDTLGLLTRTVEDLRYVYRAFTGTAPAAPTTDTRSMLLWHGSQLDEISAPMRRLLDELPPLLNKLGLDSRPLEWDDHVQALATDHSTVMAHEAALTRSELADHKHLLSAPLRELLEQGADITSADRDEALVRRDRSLDELGRLLGTNSFIIGPAALGPAPAGLAATGSPILSRPWQLLGLPVVIVPGAMTTTGLPLGIQIIGLPGREQEMLDLGVELANLLRGIAGLPEGTPS
jgi:Asp-tRNA(Asn)/Glu-tRNA(Gln) amidotransferase A subunit family amidase